jgi:ubiquitin C-terminal hydrolase
LQVKNKHSIKESLDAYVEGEMLEGDNAYYCEKCEKKVNTLKRCCIKRMPNVLFLVLKRFEFNFDTMSKSKVNDYCEFPMEINMSSYS